MKIPAHSESKSDEAVLLIKESAEDKANFINLFYEHLIEVHNLSEKEYLETMIAKEIQMYLSENTKLFLRKLSCNRFDSICSNTD
ncbi:MAG: hypothetical protein GY756_15140 [bacterium]|nr:hypothetical protein [bacterium]